MQPAADALITYLTKILDQDRFLKNIKNFTVTDRQHKLIYQEAWRENSVKILEELHQQYAIQSQFKFLGEFYQQCVQEKKYHLLALPHFSIDGERFEDVVQKLTRKEFRRPLLKRFGELTRRYGMNFLNNYYELDLIFLEAPLNLEEKLRINHSFAIPRMAKKLQDLKYFLMDYSPDRFVRILSSATEEMITETEFLLSRVQGDPKEVRRSILPRKPKDLNEIHNALDRYLIKQKRSDFDLHQDILPLHGKIINEYTIEVPSRAFDLIDTSLELKHCVHSYDKKVVNKECQILNLIKEGRRCYTVEIMIAPEGPQIVQFRGIRNDRAMEEEAGRVYREKLMSLLLAIPWPGQKEMRKG
jgi:hypothetical protein